ncbi:MAG: T9SS type A sorting domain-containing protein [Bacteroidetes bacterium]|nr:T9SS type A sorting domain-containing protein [Bacteroidota bacterium]
MLRPSTHFRIPDSAHPISFCAAIIFVLSFAGQGAHAQDVTTSNDFIVGRILGNDGSIFVMLPPGRVGLDASLNFYDKSFLTVQINGNYYTNNNVLSPIPANTKQLGMPNQLIKVGDTVRCVWRNRDSVDIIQDCWPVAFTKSGQVAMRWSFKGLAQGKTATIKCQWLLDLDISDPNEKNQPSANDAPVLLHRYGYYDQWQQYPGTYGNAVPPFYVGFLHTLPGPQNKPGLACQGYLDNRTIGTTIPMRITNGDWYTLAQNIMGPPANINSLLGKRPGTDAALLIEFNPIVVNGTQTVVGGVTSYGTSEYEECVGNMFGLMFYPHRIAWDSKQHSYTPSPFNVELYTLNPSDAAIATGIYLTLTVCDRLSIWDSTGLIKIGKSQQKPPTPGATLNPHEVLVEDFYVKADSMGDCNGDIQTCLKFSGTSSLGPPLFSSFIGDTCIQNITLECVSSDSLPPRFEVHSHDIALGSDTILVHDDRPGDKGLKSISYVLKSGGPLTHFEVDTLDPVAACVGDLATHRILFRQIDSTYGACVTFTFTDCIGHTSDTTLCFTRHAYVAPDTIAPRFSHAWSSDSMTVNTIVQDAGSVNRGMDTIAWLFSPQTNPQNITVSIAPGIQPCDGDIQQHIVTAHQKIPVVGETVYFMYTDCAGNRAFDTIVFPAPSLAVTGASAPQELTLDAVRPNPFSDAVTIEYSVPRASHIQLELFDLLGVRVATIVDKVEDGASHRVSFNATGLAAGTYILRISDGTRSVSRRVEIRR